MNTKPTENIAFTGKVRNSRRCKVWPSVLLGLGILCLATQPMVAQTSEGANKTAAMIARGDIAFTAPGQPVKILEEWVKTSKPTDILLSVTAESSIITDVTTVGNDDQTAKGQLEVYIHVDGQLVTPPAMPAPPGPGNPPQGDTGPVVFANRMYQRQTTLFDDTDATIRTFMDTRHAAGFNWMYLNAGSGLHHIEVFAQYTEFESDAVKGRAEGVIGNRSLIVQPVKSAVRETISIN